MTVYHHRIISYHHSLAPPHTHTSTHTHTQSRTTHTLAVTLKCRRGDHDRDIDTYVRSYCRGLGSRRRGHGVSSFHDVRGPKNPIEWSCMYAYIYIYVCIFLDIIHAFVFVFVHVYVYIYTHVWMDECVLKPRNRRRPRRSLSVA